MHRFGVVEVCGCLGEAHSPAGKFSLRQSRASLMSGCIWHWIFARISRALRPAMQPYSIETTLGGSFFSSLFSSPFSWTVSDAGRTVHPSGDYQASASLDGFLHSHTLGVVVSNSTLQTRPSSSQNLDLQLSLPLNSCCFYLRCCLAPSPPLVHTLYQYLLPAKHLLSLPPEPDPMAYFPFISAFYTCYLTGIRLLTHQIQQKYSPFIFISHHYQLPGSLIKDQIQ